MRSKRPKRKADLLRTIPVLLVAVFLAVQPILACQFAAAETAHSEGMACCRMQGGCHDSPRERTDCCQNHSAAGDPLSLVLPLKGTDGHFLSPSRNIFFIPAVPEIEAPTLLSTFVPIKNVARGQPAPRIYLLNSSFLI